MVAKKNPIMDGTDSSIYSIFHDGILLEQIHACDEATAYENYAQKHLSELIKKHEEQEEILKRHDKIQMEHNKIWMEHEQIWMEHEQILMEHRKIRWKHDRILHEDPLLTERERELLLKRKKSNGNIS